MYAVKGVSQLNVLLGFSLELELEIPHVSLKPGYIEEPYHLPGYTGHIPTMRYRHGGSFGRTSRNIFEDPCVAFAPIPVLVPIYDPKYPTNNSLNQRMEPNSASNTCRWPCQKIQKYPLRKVQPPRIEANRPKTATGLSEQDNNGNKGNRNSAYEIEIFQLPCWPAPTGAENSAQSNKNSASKHKNTELHQRPVTASCDTSYSHKTLNSDLNKLINEAFQQDPPPAETEHCTKQIRNSRPPSRVSSQMSGLNRNQPCKEEFSSRLNIKETLPIRPQTSYGTPNNHMPMQASTGCNRCYDTSWEADNPMKQDVRRDWNYRNFSVEPKPGGSLNTELSGTECEGTPDSVNFPMDRDSSSTPRNTRRVNRGPFAKNNDNYSSCSFDIDTNIYRFSEALAPSYTGHVPGYVFSSDGCTYGQATCGTKQYLEKCMLFNMTNDDNSI
ncbi:unnamed protein product [Allacma fusca]|uniref:Ciliary microtubule inner protein 2A-C-like domain-containing protein n=1 Tax=Allacma fusca TaxID=39272 RepID=A0A8J2PX65_9HEXA|nr:unnamed protein product [Allacma fusca]